MDINQNNWIQTEAAFQTDSDLVTVFLADASL